MLNDAVSVSALCRYLKQVLEGDIRLQNVWVEGEITNLSRSGAGHVYFTLKEGDYQLRCVMFQRRVRGMPLDNGAQVLAHGNVGLYERRGDVQIIVDFVQPAGIGARQAEFERLKEKLEAEGLFDPARKRTLPDFPARIGVVTSPSGAALHDITTVLERRWPLAEVVLAPTPVQGPDAVIGVAEALRALNAEPDIDVIIVARGGGSMEELWAFNEEIVARAIFSSQAPVVSAVGHETDFTIADFVADVRCPTPSAAAETVAPNRGDVSREVAGMLASLLLDVRARLNNSSGAIDRAGHRMRAGLPSIAHLQDNVTAHVRHAASAVERSLERRSERIAAFSAQVRSLDPRATLARGYAVVQLRDGKQAITSVAQATAKAKLDIHVKDGKFPAEVSRQYGF